MNSQQKHIENKRKKSKTLLTLGKANKKVHTKEYNHYILCVHTHADVCMRYTFNTHNVALL